MEKPKECDEKQGQKSVPRIPIQTYRWEDVRRDRIKGGYPWTYLDKEPFSGNIDCSQFTMEGMQKSKSASALEKSSPRISIQDVTTNGNYSEFITDPEPSSYIVITELSGDHSNHSKDEPRGSVTIEEDVSEPEVLNLELAESSDSISQYLDKDAVPEISTEKPGPSAVPDTSTIAESAPLQRAKSEEPHKKRKRSIDSSYSRKSLSKLAFLKKLKAAKEKIKISKLNLPRSLKREESQKSKKSVEDKPKPEEKKQAQKLRKPTNENPVYIHIPLKPPEGQSDEFSYLEFEEKRPEPSTSNTTDPIKNGEIKQVPAEESAASATISNLQPMVQLQYDPSVRRESENPDEIVAIEILKSESIDLADATKNGISVEGDLGDGNIIIIQPDPESKNQEDVIIIMPGNDKQQPEGGTLTRSKSTKSIKSTKSTRPTKSSSSSRKVRAKSAEPERKRKLSGESSYSRISLSKLGILKKMKEAKDKIKFPKLALGRSDSKKDKPKKDEKPKEAEVPVPEAKETKKGQPKKATAEPSYIHIPLKPPAGQTDEFSYLEFEEKREVKPTKIQDIPKEQESSLESPVSPKTDDVQFIFLTPPSDDEILDSHPDIPETPSSENAPFFSSKVDELKVLAKDAVQGVSPETKNKKLDSVAEEQAVDKIPPVEESNQEQNIDADIEKAAPVTEKMVVDEEDGLKLTESAMAKQEQNIKSKEILGEVPSEEKSSLKSGEELPVLLKKKVSFKRRSRDESRTDGDYEEIQAPGAKTAQKEDLGILGTSQSMSVDEEKSYLDDKIIKSTSLEEDYNRWSKLSDHEYEPVNPPPDNGAAQPIPTVQVVDTDGDHPGKTLSLASSTTSLERRMLGEDSTMPTTCTAQEMQTNIESRYFVKSQESAQAGSKPDIVKEEQQPSKPEGPGRFQKAFKNQTDKLKSKIHGIKKPNIKMPSRPKMDKFKFEKPKFHLPKIPDTAKINLPSFSLPRRNSAKRSLKERQLSTESNAGDSKKKYFDFSTYPRIFKKKPKDDFDDSLQKEKPVVEFATVPRTNNRKQDNNKWGNRDTIRIPLHPEDSEEKTNDREDSVERRMASHTRYDEDIDIDDAYEKENQEIHRASPFSYEYNSRWNHGSFHNPERNLEFQNTRNQQITDLDSPGDAPQGSFDGNTGKDVHSSESSLGIHRRGVLEEIDSDEFFLRQKGISQDNIEVGMYLSSEIREAFKYPTNALMDLQRDDDFGRGSNQSLPETPSKRKPIRKPKRKKTPHVSQEQISFDQDSEPEIAESPPPRPKRRSKKRKNKEEVVIPYQETIHVETASQAVDSKSTQENENRQRVQQPEIKLIDPYADFGYGDRYESEEESFKDEDVAKPVAPPRRNRSLKSLNFSEHDSILGEFNVDKDIIPQNAEVYTTEHEYIIPTPEEPPAKPDRTFSRRSKSLSEDTPETPTRPARTRSQSRTRSRNDSLTSEPPCVEEPCIESYRDYMGYAVIDKNIKREPPLPPPRTPPRRKRSLQFGSDQKFSTVARSTNIDDEDTPVRPQRNYSTLGPSRPPRRKAPSNMTDEEKENIDITQYIEIDDEPNRDLHSGVIVQKMRDRPLPAPPRPPRKTRTLQEITSEENVESLGHDQEEGSWCDETEVSTRAGTIDDCVGEQVRREQSEQSRPRSAVTTDIDEPTVTVERRLITPTHFTHEQETITHGSLIVEPVNGAQIIPEWQITRREVVERTIPITRDYPDEEPSEVPEDFKKLKDPPATQVFERTLERPVVADSSTGVELLKTQKLQVSDLDVDKLNVNELTANKIVVSEIEGGSIQVSEIASRTGTLRLGDIELPPSVVQQIFERLQSAAAQTPESATSGQKKTPIEPEIVPTEITSAIELTHAETLEEPLETQTDSLDPQQEPAEVKSEEQQPPQPPVRTDSSIRTPPESPIPQRPPRNRIEPAEPEVDDEPPPRPPHPQVEYFPSQPPASFYDLKAQQYVDNMDIPTAPRRRRQPLPPRVSPSSSEEECPVAIPPSRRRHRTPDQSIPQLTGQLIQACGSAANGAIKRLITHFTENVLGNADGQQDMHVMIVILLVLVAGLILLGIGDGKTVHHHHWEYFNPPRDM